MTTLRAHGWLLLGVVAGLLAPAFGLPEWLASTLEAALPLPWGRIGLGGLIFWAGAGLHFRSHWASSLACLRRERQRQAAAARLLESAREDGISWVRVIQENLQMVADGRQRRQEAELYLSGALAHARKLEELFQRLDGIGRRLDQGEA